MAEERQLIFLDIPYSSGNDYVINLPDQIFWRHYINYLKLKCWCIEGVTYTNDGGSPPHITGPLYFQIKFCEGLHCRTNNNFNVDMIQLPIESLGGWPTGNLATADLELPVNNGAQQLGRLILQVYGPGSNPAPLIFGNLALWLEVGYREHATTSTMTKL